MKLVCTSTNFDSLKSFIACTKILQTVQNNDSWKKYFNDSALRKICIVDNTSQDSIFPLIIPGVGGRIKRAHEFSRYSKFHFLFFFPFLLIFEMECVGFEANLQSVTLKALVRQSYGRQ